MRLEEIRNVIDETPMPPEILKKQIYQEKHEKDKQERLENKRFKRDKLGREKHERERIEREKYDVIIYYKNIIDISSHRELSPTSINHNMITPSINNLTPKIKKLNFQMSRLIKIIIFAPQVITKPRKENMLL